MKLSTEMLQKLEQRIKEKLSEKLLLNIGVTIVIDQQMRVDLFAINDEDRMTLDLLLDNHMKDICEIVCKASYLNWDIGKSTDGEEYIYFISGYVTLSEEFDDDLLEDYFSINGWELEFEGRYVNGVKRNVDWEPDLSTFEFENKLPDNCYIL